MNENGIKLSNVMDLILLRFFRGLLHKIVQIAISYHGNRNVSEMRIEPGDG
jgi:hypothetical protein